MWGACVGCVYVQCMWGVCVRGVCGECMWGACVGSLCGECVGSVWGTCGGSVWGTCVGCVRGARVGAGRAWADRCCALARMIAQPAPRGPVLCWVTTCGSSRTRSLSPRPCPQPRLAGSQGRFATWPVGPTQPSRSREGPGLTPSSRKAGPNHLWAAKVQGVQPRAPWCCLAFHTAGILQKTTMCRVPQVDPVWQEPPGSPGKPPVVWVPDPRDPAPEPHEHTDGCPVATYRTVVLPVLRSIICI